MPGVGVDQKKSSVANIVAPMLFAWTYNWSVAGGRDFPAAMFLVRMVVGAILPELFFRYPNATQPSVSRPFCARFAPSFRRPFALSGFLAPRRRERAKNGGKWAKFGGEAAEKQR